MRVVAIVQARMGSTRLPGKVLLPLAGRTLLAHTLERVARAVRVDEVRVATSQRAVDSAIAEEARARDVCVTRGLEEDVLARYAQAAREGRADAVVRITGDCPLIAPELVDRAVDTLALTGADYVSNTLSRRFPRGLDVEVLRAEALERAAREARTPGEREHVTPYIWNRPEQFALAELAAEPDEVAPEFRVCVDRPEDYGMVCATWALLPVDDPSARSLVSTLRLHPWLEEINGHVEQKPLELFEAAGEGA